MMNHFLMTLPSSLSSHHLCLILVILHQVFSVLSHTEDDVTRFKLKANNMVPFVIPEMPQHTLSNLTEIHMPHLILGWGAAGRRLVYMKAGITKQA
ncbi:unnamed protein product [Bemisia tabaci]|uniref:Secreted protein n=1 Tax=Bemisia tabaci TaxID=7038 RepID=A0A9P0AAD2_BEMTA|nr:unnamed protein product [Bemisia tabaci]